MYINSFLIELNKKIDTVDLQLKDFETKTNKINELKQTITRKTLKDIDNIQGSDLILLNEEEFNNLINIFDFDDKKNKIKCFSLANSKIMDYQRLINEENQTDKDEVLSYTKWLDEQASMIKECINDFNNNNKDYYNNLKSSEKLYKKYINYFKDNNLIKPIYDIDEFNEFLKKSGIITSEKWKILKYIGEKNMSLMEKEKIEKKDFTDEEVLKFAENILYRERMLLSSINEDVLKKALDFLDYDDEKIKSMNLNEDVIVKYQKIPIIDTMKNLYIETVKMLKNETDEDAVKIENNLKDLIQLIDSYDVIKKLES